MDKPELTSKLGRRLLLSTRIAALHLLKDLQKLGLIEAQPGFDEWERMERLELEKNLALLGIEVP